MVFQYIPQKLCLHDKWILFVDNLFTRNIVKALYVNMYLSEASFKKASIYSQV